MACRHKYGGTLACVELDCHELFPAAGHHQKFRGAGLHELCGYGDQIMRKHEHIIVYMKPVISMLLMVLAGCTDGRSSAAGAGASTENIGSSVVVDVKDFIENSGVKPMTPQLWIFDGTGEMISTEYGYLPGQPLNIEANKLGPGGQ